MENDYQKIEKYLSKARLRRYEKVCDYDKRRTLKLYQANLRLSRAYYPVLSLFEIVFRNALNEKLIDYFNDTYWLKHQKDQFMNDLSLRGKRKDGTSTKGYLKNEVDKVMKKLGREASPGKAVADLPFGFWVAMFDAKHYRLLEGSPLDIFIKLPANINRKAIHDRLKKVNNFRNRVYHNEPIIFSLDANNQSVFDLQEANEVYKIIKSFFSWFQLDFNKWTNRIDNIPYELKRSESVMKHYPKWMYYLKRIFHSYCHYKDRYLK